MKSRNKSKAKAFTPNDKYFYKAKQDWYRARSAYKLLEIQEKFWVIWKWTNILDLWAYPWSWLQVVKNITKWEAKIIWIDLQEIKKIKWVNTYVADINWSNIEDIFKENWIIFFDTILSDIAPKTTWIPDVDQYKSVELNLRILEFANTYLKTWGYLVSKIFRWEDFNDFWLEAHKTFPKMKTFKPKSCRWRSVELFVIWKKES